MKGLVNLIADAQPSVVAMQSGVLLLFVVAFTVVLVKLAGRKKAQQCDELGRRLIED